MKAWQVGFVLSKEEWQTLDAALSDAFEALTVKPVRENDPTSPEQICLIFAHETEAAQAVNQVRDILDIFEIPAPAIIIEALPDIDWLQHVYETLKPIEAGRFFVHGSHIKENIPEDRVAIVIEAASGFGTGEHPTTKGCLLVLDKYFTTEKPRRILDMGCGSGILSIAAALVLPKTDAILGVDIHAESVRVSIAHAAANQVSERITYVHGDGFHASEVSRDAPFDLVLANILAQPLIEMASAMNDVGRRDVILSGFTTEQSPYVEAPYLKLGFAVQDQIIIDGWVAVWLRKN